MFLIPDQGHSHRRRKGLLPQELITNASNIDSISNWSPIVGGLHEYYYYNIKARQMMISLLDLKKDKIKLAALHSIYHCRKKLSKTNRIRLKKHLVGLAKSRNANIRAQVAICIVYHKYYKLRPILIEFLNDRAYGVRQNSVYSFRMWRDKEIEPEIKKLQEKEKNIKVLKEIDEYYDWLYKRK